MSSKKKLIKSKKPIKSKKASSSGSSSSDALIKAIEPLFEKFYERVDQRFEKIDQRLERVDQRFEKIDQHLERVDQRFEKIDQTINGLRNDINGVRVLVEQLDKKFTDAMIPSQMTSEHNVVIKDHEGRITTLEQDSTTIKAAIKTFKEI